MEKVFVYGTLKDGEKNHYLLDNAKFLGNDRIEGVMYNLDNLCPAIDLNMYGTVFGEVYEIDDETLVLLDTLEVFPTLYDRRKVKTLDGGYTVWVYCMWGLEDLYNIKLE